jgi:hypothetical protein
MEMTNKSTKFWTMMLLMVLGMSVLVLMIDFSIKGAILEESLKLRREIQGWKATNGTKPEGRADFPGPSHRPDDSPILGDVLAVKPTGMEAGSPPNGTTGSAASTSQRRANGRTARNTPPIHPGSE